MTDDPRDELLERLPKGGTYVEVGVKEGSFSRRILDICSPDRLYLIDPWRITDDVEHRGAIFGPGVAQSHLDAMYQRVVARFVDDPRVVVLRAPSTSAAADFADEVCDVVYIDGDHLAVAADLEAWWPTVKSGGLLTGDDYNTSDRWWGDAVTRDVDAFAAKVEIVPEIVVTRQFVFPKP